MTEMLYVDLPTGGGYGWGSCGDGLADALAALTPIVRISGDVRPSDNLPGPLLQAIRSDLQPLHPGLLSTRRVGYAVFENDLAVRRHGARALRDFDAVATASRWCEGVLRDAGLNAVFTVHHGVDGRRFRAEARANKRITNRFIVFSGGKFEFRKGQDIVVRAFREFSERHDDVELLAAWHNPSLASAATMSASPYWRFELLEGRPFDESLRVWLANTGVDMRRVTLLPAVPNVDLPRIYKSTDVGLFPNRCEGATNLVMMEYMACGHAVVASTFSGQGDVITDANSIPLRRFRPFFVVRQNRRVGCWAEPDMEEIIEGLELAYENRDDIAKRGAQAGADLANWTWEAAARRFLSLLHVGHQA